MPITLENYPTYFGGKSGAGTYQTLINHVPPCKVYVSGCLGNCGLTRHIKPAELMVLNDLDSDLIASWRIAMADRGKVEFHNIDVIKLLREVLKWHDEYDTFIYLDPPYRFVTRKGQRPVYKYEFTEQQHIGLLTTALSFNRARIMINHYPNDLYDEFLQGWHTHDFPIQTRAGKALDRIYMNYAIGDHLHDYRFIGKDFRQREAYQRVKNNMLEKLNRLDPQLRNAILTDLASQK